LIYGLGGIVALRRDQIIDLIVSALGVVTCVHYFVN
jgi:hypothetical protein